jgi:hypothetical protein
MSKGFQGEGSHPELYAYVDRGLGSCQPSEALGTGLPSTAWTTAKELVLLPGGGCRAADRWLASAALGQALVLPCP